MLDSLRKYSRSWVFKALLVILMISFAMWGIGGDMLQSSISGSGVAEVGEVTLAPSQVFSEYTRQMSQTRQTAGNLVDNPQMQQIIFNDVLNRNITRALLQQGAEDVGVLISDAVVADEVRRMPTFQNNGAFDINLYRQTLGASGMTEVQFQSMVRSDLVREHYVAALGQENILPDTITNAHFRYRQEQRQVSAILIATEEQADIPPASDAELEAYHTANQDRFMAPEYRDFSLVRITEEALLDQIELSEDDILAFFDQNQARFETAEVRNVSQMVFFDDAEAATAASRLAGGEEFLAVAQDMLGLDEASVNLGDVTLESVPAELAPVFDLTEGAVSAPIQSPLGVHIAIVNSVTPAQAADLEAARADIEAQLKSERAQDLIFQLSTDIELELGGGATIDEAARAAGLTVERVLQSDANGQNPAGSPASQAGLLPSVLQSAFSKDLGGEPELVQDDINGFALVQVDKITAPALRPLADVKDQVRAAVELERRTTAADQVAEEALAQLQAGTPIEQVAEQYGVPVETPAPFVRSFNGGAAVPPSLVQEAFRLNRGESAKARSVDGYIVATLTDIIRDPSTSDPALRTSVVQDLENGLLFDLEAQLTSALRDRHPVSINNQVINQLLNPQLPQ